ncbi:hypothetical protein SAMN04488020_10966 [Palleronia marisminoris]|nr:hypothetical protein [Palleronia marisminoris]SFH27605.1 hypothetical protein SAMN04488020_10966 [Palleronia marisminoris]
MTIETIIIVSGGLALAVAGAAYARWSRARLERENRSHPAE